MIVCRKEAISKEQVDQWLANWEILREEIHSSHAARDGKAKDIMQKGIGLYETFIIKASNVTLESIQLSDEYEALPINGAERLQFIKRRPGQYACYRQLDELFIETKKRMARLRLKKD
ncbi:YpoC family protein [Viridibacillus sp. NPDC093762]|uniref:YpoC family protein n=1 Tax=Viridibacillus sp. NPDC093762 TaxID=3390720 RepID=UPI003D084E48